MRKANRAMWEWVVVIWEGGRPREVARRTMWSDADARAGQVREGASARVTIEDSESWALAMGGR